MAVIHDVIPAIELFQPTSVDDALALQSRHGSKAWVLVIVPVIDRRPGLSSK